jgi:hypothetical protein
MKVTTGRRQLSTTIARDGKGIGEVIEVEAPTMTREVFEVWHSDGSECEMIPGLKRTSPMRFTVLLEAE